MPAEPPASIGMSDVPDLPKIDMATAARSPASGMPSNLSAIIPICSSADMPCNCWAVSPRAPRAFAASSLPPAAAKMAFCILRTPVSTPAMSVPVCWAANLSTDNASVATPVRADMSFSSEPTSANAWAAARMDPITLVPIARPPAPAIASDLPTDCIC